MTEHPSRRMGNNLNIEFSILENPVKLCLEFRGDTALENRALKMGISIPTPLRCIHARTLSTPFQISAEIKIIFTRRREGGSVEKDDRSPRLFPCVHTMLVTSRGRYLVTGSDGLENRSRRNRQGVEEGKEGRVESVFSPSLSFVEIFVSNLLQESINHAF